MGGATGEFGTGGRHCHGMGHKELEVSRELLWKDKQHSYMQVKYKCSTHSRPLKMLKHTFKRIRYILYISC